MIADFETKFLKFMSTDTYFQDIEKNFFKTFSFGCTGSSFAGCGPSVGGVSRGYSLAAVHRLLIVAASRVERGHQVQGLQQLQLTGSAVATHGPESAAQWLCCTSLAVPWHVVLPGLGIQPMSPALAGKFFTTEPPGKPLRC